MVGEGLPSRVRHFWSNRPLHGWEKAKGAIPDCSICEIPATIPRPISRIEKEEKK